MKFWLSGLGFLKDVIAGSREFSSHRNCSVSQASRIIFVNSTYVQNTQWPRSPSAMCHWILSVSNPINSHKRTGWYFPNKSSSESYFGESSRLLLLEGGWGRNWKPRWQMKGLSLVTAVAPTHRHIIVHRSAKRGGIRGYSNHTNDTFGIKEKKLRKKVYLNVENFFLKNKWQFLGMLMNPNFLFWFIPNIEISVSEKRHVAQVQKFVCPNFQIK